MEDLVEIGERRIAGALPQDEEPRTAGDHEPGAGAGLRRHDESRALTPVAPDGQEGESKRACMDRAGELQPCRGADRDGGDERQHGGAAEP